MIGNAEWHIVPLRQVLARAAGGVQGAGAVMFEGLDEFYSSVSIARAMDDYAFIALRMNGEMLPAGHGFPARVILPDLYGMKQPRWLRRIRLLRGSETTSYWEKRGWAGEVPIKSMSRLDPPPDDAIADTPIDLTGIAFGGARGISAVQVSLDGGRNWVSCRLTTGERPHVWSLWHYRWERPTAGRHELLVRAADGTGEWQTAARQRPFPDGASGYDRAELAIRERE